MCQLSRQLSFKKIIDGIQTDKLFDLLLFDVETPPDVQKELQDFPVIIKKLGHFKTRCQPIHAKNR